MAVIIDDFEVVVEPPASEHAAGAEDPTQTQSAATPAPGPTPADIQRIMRHRELRDLRLRAH